MVRVGYRDSKDVVVMYRQINGLLELGVGPDALQVPFDSWRFVENRAIFQVQACGEVLLEADFQMCAFSVLRRGIRNGRSNYAL